MLVQPRIMKAEEEYNRESTSMKIEDPSNSELQRNIYVDKRKRLEFLKISKYQ